MQHTREATAKTPESWRSGMKMKVIFAGAVLTVFPQVASAQISLTGTSPTYSQNFNGLTTSTSFPAWANNGTLAGWSLFISTGAAPSTYNGGTGSSTTGSFYSFGAPSNTERAFGGLGSGGSYFGSPASDAVAGWIALALTNSTGLAVKSFTISFSGEQWRDGGAATPNAQTMQLQWGYGTNFTDVATWNTPGGSFDWTSPVFTNTGSGAAVDGNVAGKVLGKGGTIGSQNWSSGSTLWIRWIEKNDAGNDHGLAIDDLSFSAIVLRSLIWNPPGTNWNTTETNTNWLDGGNAAAFIDAGDTVSFTDAGLASGSSVAIDAGGVIPAAVNVSNTSGVYTLSGGAIGGSGGVTKTNAGALVLSGSNTYSGVTAVSGGTVKLGSATALGNATGGTTVASGAVLDLNGKTVGTEAITSLRGSGISNGGALINSDTGNSASLAGNVFMSSNSSVGGAGELTLSGIVSGDRTLTKVGAGKLILSNPSNSFTTLVINAGTVGVGIDANLGTAPSPSPATNITLSNGALSMSAGFTLDPNRGITISSGKIGTIAVESGTGVYAGVIAESGLAHFAKAGSGTLVLSGANTYTGKSSVNGGTLSINSIAYAGSSPSPLGNPVAGPNSIIDLTGSIRYTGNGHSTDRTINLTGAGMIAADGGSGSLNLEGGFTGTDQTLTLTGSGNGQLQYGGIATGAGTVTKAGSGKWTLKSSSSYTGNTQIQQGTLALSGSGSIANSPSIILSSGAKFDVSAVTGGFSLAASQTLAGSGNVYGLVNVASGTLSPGTSAGSIAFDSNVTLSSSSTLVIEAGGADAGVDFDLITVSGSGKKFALNGAKLELHPTANAQTGVAYTIVQATNGASVEVTNFFQGLTNGIEHVASSVYKYTVSWDVDHIEVTFSAVPEPSSAALLLAAGGMMVRRRRK